MTVYFYLQYLLQVIDLLKPKIQTLMEKCNTVGRTYLEATMTHQFFCKKYILAFLLWRQWVASTIPSKDILGTMYVLTCLCVAKTTLLPGAFTRDVFVQNMSSFSQSSKTVINSSLPFRHKPIDTSKFFVPCAANTKGTHNHSES